jgi:UPF0755 protein
VKGPALAALFLLISLALGASLFALYLFFPVSREPRVVEVKVERGEPFAAVVDKLARHRIISHGRLFSLWAHLVGADKKIHWGLYRFELPLSPHEVLTRLRLGQGVFLRVTIPEGLTVAEIADLLESHGVVEKRAFLAEAKNPDLLAHLGREQGLEGYLFPDTYYFIPLGTARDALVTMAERFRKAFTPEMERRAHDLGLTAHEAVTLASLIEKETGIEEERPLVSAVFHNRLKANMPLQSDPTVIYGLSAFSGNLTRRDLRTPTRYNTYRISGLPPGPICNPGISSLRAALAPADVPYLYFVSKNDGSHAFSVTLAEHNRAVRAYQQKGGSRGVTGAAAR